MGTLNDILYQHCLNYINERIENAEKAIASLQESTANETKSTAGDKYETAREMLQQEMNIAQSRLSDARLQLQVLQRIETPQQSVIAVTGHVVCTDTANYYLAINAGNMVIDGTKYFTISPTSPIGMLIKGKDVGASFEFNGRTGYIKSIS